MNIYGIKVQYGEQHYWHLLDDELFLDESVAEKRCIELENNRLRDKLLVTIYHRYEVEELEVK